MSEPFDQKRDGDSAEWSPNSDPNRFDSDPLAELARLIDDDPFADMAKPEPAQAPEKKPLISEPPVEIDPIAASVEDETALAPEPTAAPVADIPPVAAPAPTVEPVSAPETVSTPEPAPDPSADAVFAELERSLADTPMSAEPMPDPTPAALAPSSEPAAEPAPSFEPEEPLASDPVSPDVERLFADISAAHSEPLAEQSSPNAAWDHDLPPASEPTFDSPAPFDNLASEMPTETPVEPSIGAQPRYDDVADPYAVAASGGGAPAEPSLFTEDRVSADPIDAPMEQQAPATDETAAYPEPEFTDYDPSFDDSGHMLPLDEEYADEVAEQSSNRRGLWVVGAILGVVVLGGGVVVGYNSIFGDIESGPPPTVKAEGTPNKTTPEDPGGAQIPNQNKLVYDRLEGNGAQPEEKVVSREEPVQPSSSDGVRVIGPAPVRTAAAPNSSDNGAATPPAAAPQPAAGVPQATAPNQPKRVKTVVVKPDGTIVGTPETPRQPEPVTPPAATTTQPQPVQPVATQTPQQPQSPASNFTPPAAPQRTAAQTGQGSGQPISLSPTNIPAARNQTAQPTVQPTAPAAPQPAPAATPIPTRTVTARPVRNTIESDPSRVGLDNTAQPRVASAPQPTATPQPTAAATPTAAPSGSYVVQIAARKSQAQAQSAADSIKARYSSALAGRNPQVVRADLGDRGVFYRVGVGPFSGQQEAASACSRMKSAGLDCFVRRN